MFQGQTGLHIVANVVAVIFINEKKATSQLVAKYIKYIQTFMQLSYGQILEYFKI